MQRAREIWLGAYGAAAGDLALQELCSGGLWVGGGTAAKQSMVYARAFWSRCGPRTVSSFISGLQVTALIDPDAGLFSAACRARMLAESSGRLPGRGTGMAQPRIGQKVVVDVPAATANLGPGFDCLGAALDLNNRFAMSRIEAAVNGLN